MFFPIPLGTTLQNRYCLIDLNPPEKFYRSYLAKDLQQQNQLCTVLEITTPEIADRPAFKKQFQDEVENLYRLRHPQLPKIYSSFEENDRLFLIQDYIEGKSYSRQIKQQQTPLNEAEVIQILLQILPPLEYLHTFGFTHGQISPENIIQPASIGNLTPETTLLPVLINLNLVPQLLHRLLPDNPETYPQSDVGRDLYDLAITATTFLTGIPYPELIDKAGQMRWDWQTLTPISIEFGQILNRSLSYQPGVPYHSASELRHALQKLSQPPQPTPQLSPQPRPKKPTTVAHKWGNPWAYLFSLLLVGGVGAGTWAALNLLLNPNFPPIPTWQMPGKSTSKATPSKIAPTPLPSPTTSPVVLKLSPQGKTTLEGSLKDQQSIIYKISLKAGQQLNASLADKAVAMTVLNSNRQPLDAQALQVQRYTAPLFSGGDYFIQLVPASNTPQSKYKLDVNINNYFPKKICQEPSNLKAENWYPVFVDYTKQNLETIQSKYCRNTFIIPATATTGPSVQVAAFGSVEQAKAFAELMKTQLGSALVGKPTKTPKISCSDASTGNEKTWYPVYLEYSKEKYDQILSYCPTASVTDRPARQGTYIEVAAFLDRSKAEQLAAFINQEIGGAELGEASNRNAAESNAEK
ncbi:protein kinase [Ancylothrix sp. C2]|uniref:serine/threonine protein kinase n=1 Tax=Ancylothrix sp. D3o TaxID=2953691 RepID=UPI0021BAC6FF|nr:protein kinase [Ancylothrix sp. D3o]MCT7950975.1 protein kinase [Ancylothrix sp. D3o]